MEPTNTDVTINEEEITIKDMEGIEFEDLFKLDEIQSIQDSFAAATGVASIITRTNGEPIAVPSNFCRLCIGIIRETEKGFTNCKYSDSVIGRFNPSGPIISKCLSGGLYDGGASITVYGKHLANWLIGQIIVEEEFDEESMLQYATDIGADVEAYKRALKDVTRMSREQFMKVADFLFIMANQMSQLAAQNLMKSKSIALMKEERARRRETEELYYKLINVSPDGIVMMNADEIIEFASSKTFEMLNTDKKEDIIGKNIMELMVDEDREKGHGNFTMRLRGEIIYGNQYTLKRIDGTTFLSEMNSSIVTDDNGAVKGIISTIRDITERIEHQRIIAESEKNLSEILKRSPSPIIMVHNDGKTGFINDCFTKTFGYDIVDIPDIGKLWNVAFPDMELRTKAVSDWNVIKAIESGVSNVSYEWIVTCKDNTQKIASVNYTSLTDKNILIINDITQSKEYERRIVNNNLLLGSIIDSPSDIIIYSLDVDFRYTSFNSNYKREIMKLYNVDIKLGMDIGEAVKNEEELERIKRNFARVLFKGEQFKIYEKYGRDDNVQHYESAYNPIFDHQNSICGVTLFSTNITEKIKVRAALFDSEERFRLAVNQLPGTIWTVDANLVYTMSVGAGLSKLNLKPGQVVGKTVADMFKTSAGNKSTTMHQKALQGKSVAFTYRFDKFDYEVKLEPLRDENGQIIGVLGIALDISERVKAEVEMKKTEMKFTQLVSNIPVGILVHSPDTLILHANREACSILGLDWGEAGESALIEKYWRMYNENYELIAPAEYPLKIAIETGKPVNNVTVGYRNDNDGSFKWVLLNAFPIYNYDNELEQVIVVLNDITGKKQAEEAIEIHRQQMISILDGMDEPVYVQDPETYELLYTNEAFNRIFGTPANEKCFHIIQGLDEPCEFCSNGIIFGEGYDSYYTWEFRNHTSNRWFKCIDRVIKWTGDRRVRFELAIDITDIKLARQELEDTKALFTAALEQIPTGVIIVDSKDNSFRVVNKTADELLLTDIAEMSLTVKDDFRSLPWQTLSPQGDAIDSNDTPIARALLQKQPSYNEEFIIRRKDGSDVWVLINATPVYNSNNELIAGITIFNDITEKVNDIKYKEKLIENLETKNMEMERYTYTVSHDLKSPLITIKGFVGMVQQDLIAQEYARMNSDLARISTAADKMLDLLDGLLKVSRIGRLVNEYTAINLNSLISEIIEMLHIQIRDRFAAVIVQENLPIIYADKHRILEVLLNLVENSLKFCPKDRKPTIEIGCYHQDMENVFYVKDNGMGIDSKYHEKVFGLFEKLDINTPGSGVGLALVKRIIEIHGGKIRIGNNETGKGTTFYFTVPNTQNN